MKKFLLLSFLFFGFYFLLNSNEALALSPIFIKKQTFQAPPPQNDLPRDPDYYSNDIDNVETENCVTNEVIGQDFSPISVTNGTAPPTIIEQIITQISQMLEFGINPISNTALDKEYSHIANRFSGNPFDNTAVDLAFKNFDDKNSASNASTRAFTNKEQNCLKSQRIAAAAALRYDGLEGTNNDEAVACKKLDGKIDAISAGYICVGQKIRLSDIAIAINMDPTLNLSTCLNNPVAKDLFYEKDANCALPEPDPDQPVELHVIAKKAPFSTSLVTPLEACDLFRTVVEITDISTSASIIETCNTNKITGKETCTKEKRGIPLGQLATDNKLAKLTTPIRQTSPPDRLCDTATQKPTVHRSNRISILATAVAVYGSVIDKLRHITDTVQVTHIFDKRIPVGKADDSTFLNNLIPLADQIKYATANIPGSSTDGQHTKDVGNPVPRQVFAKQFYPKSWSIWTNGTSGNIAGGAWQPRPATPIIGSAWDTIAAACAEEAGCQPEFMYGLWLTETGVEDCTALLQQPGPNGCISPVGAKGPFQFMDNSWPEVADASWNIASLFDSARAACRMWSKMGLWDKTGDREAFALRFSSLDVVGIPKTWLDRCWNCGNDGKNQAYTVWDYAQTYINSHPL